MQQTALPRLLILLAIALGLGRLGFHEFVEWDDRVTIHHNPNLNPPTWGGIGYYWTAIGRRAAMELYDPLVYTYWGALASIAQLDVPDQDGIRLNPYVFHLASVALHMVAALVVFEILRLLVRNAWAACAGALLWGLHPVQVEAVGWASGAKDLLCGLFSFVAILQYLKFRQTGARWRSVLAVAALLAAMLSKPIALVVPPITLMLDVAAMKTPLRSSLLRLWPWFALSAACAAVAKFSQSTTDVPTVALIYRPLVAADALAFYLAKLFVPIRLAIDYGRTPIRALESGWIWYTWLAPAAAGTVLWLARRKLPLAMVGALIFVIGLLPVLGLVPFGFQHFSTVADHYLYIPMLGVAVVFAAVTARWRAAMLAAPGILVILAVLSFRQAATWKDDMALFNHALAVNPRSFAAYNNLGAVFVRRQDLARGEQMYRKAIELLPDYATAHQNLAQVLMQTGRRDEAFEHIRRMIEIQSALPEIKRPDLDAERISLGQYLLSQGRGSEAAEQFRAVLRHDPANPDARNGMQEATRQNSSATTRRVG